MAAIDRPESTDDLRATLASTQAELHAARGELAALASELSHDLNNSLGTIRGFAELLVEDESLDGKVHRTAERILSSAERSLRTVERAVAEARARAVATAPDSVDLADLVRSVVDARAPELEAAGVELVIDGTTTVPGFRPKLERIVEIVLDNVIAHAPGSTVALRLAASGERVLVELADDGPGFDARDAERAFEPGLALAGPGEGYGLAELRQLVTDHGGRVWIRTSPGAGTSVHIALPEATTAVLV